MTAMQDRHCILLEELRRKIGLSEALSEEVEKISRYIHRPTRNAFRQQSGDYPKDDSLWKVREMVLNELYEVEQEIIELRNRIRMAGR